MGIVSSNNIYLDSKYTNVGQPKYCYYHRQTTTPKTHSKKKEQFSIGRQSHSIGTIFLLETLSLLRITVIYVSSPFPLPKKKKKKKNFVKKKKKKKKKKS